MKVPSYTLVCGVDKKHLIQLERTFPTWTTHKPTLLTNPMLVFYDRLALRASDISIRHPDLKVVPWPPEGIEVPFGGDDKSKWTSIQRNKMLSGFVHVPAKHVETEYWLKIDTDVVACGKPDWISPQWFSNRPAIISHPWGFTKPADQMIRLDIWTLHCWRLLMELKDYPPLNLIPASNVSDRLRHNRIISWCGFFRTDFSKICSDFAERTCGSCQIPVPSQDGYMWYLAERLKLGIRRERMKGLGWEHWNTEGNIIAAVQRVMRGKKSYG